MIIIQLEQGNYYSLAGSGREIWQMLGDGLTPSQIGEALGRRYAAEPAAIEGMVRGLVAELLEENLLDRGPASNGAAPPLAAEAAADGAAQELTPPRLEKYTDMQDFLLIDPIHDVTEAGWPDVKPSD